MRSSRRRPHGSRPRSARLESLQHSCSPGGGGAVVRRAGGVSPLFRGMRQGVGEAAGAETADSRPPLAGTPKQCVSVGVETLEGMTHPCFKPRHSLPRPSGTGVKSSDGAGEVKFSANMANPWRKAISVWLPLHGKSRRKNLLDPFFPRGNATGGLKPVGTDQVRESSPRCATRESARSAAGYR